MSKPAFQLAVLVLAVSLVMAVAPSHRAAADGVGLAEDAYHYAAWADGRHDAFYTEWWYFNFFDQAQNVQGIFTYFVFDPSDLLGQGLSQVATVAYTPTGSITAIDVYGHDAFSASAAQADVSIAGNTIQVISPDLYRVAGSSEDGRLAWDLEFVRASDSWRGLDRVPVGTLPWEKMSWLVYMPAATVTGQLTVDGHAYQVSAPGYHDHNWGEWVFTNALWNWAQYSQAGLALELGDFIGKPEGVLSVDVEGQRQTFSKEQYTLVHTRWAWDEPNRGFYPTESLLFAENEALRLQLRITAIETVPLRANAPPGLPDPVIYEQTARYQGTVQLKRKSGPPAVVSIDGPGFKEYTANAWP